MKIKTDDIRIFASRFLKVLEEQGVKSTQDLEKLIGKEVEIEQQAPDFLSFEKRPSNLSTMAYTISYIKPESGIPIEIKINSELDYSQVIIKTQELIEGYTPFSVDPFENIIQNKLLRSCDISLSIKELIALSKLNKFLLN